tara:strand:- start:55 stop:519 length:465 start_codon:yes stop_codon:yes gene_type:complete
MASTDNTDTMSSQDFDTTITLTGRVKWFNNKAGYGFCTVVGNDENRYLGEDIFVHHSGVNVHSEQYKYLVQGEYVHFNLRSSDNQSHPYQAANLTGLFGGMLMCETRSQQREQTNSLGETSKKQKRVRLRGSGPRGEKTDKQWSLSENNVRDNV